MLSLITLASSGPLIVFYTGFVMLTAAEDKCTDIRVNEDAALRNISMILQQVDPDRVGRVAAYQSDLQLFKRFRDYNTPAFCGEVSAFISSFGTDNLRSIGVLR